jgi:hypothetical protein
MMTGEWWSGMTITIHLIKFGNVLERIIRIAAVKYGDRVLPVIL